MLDVWLLAILPGFQEPVAFPELGLTITLPALEALERKPKTSGTRAGEWTGKWNGLDARVRFDVLPNAKYDCFEPEDVVEAWREDLRKSKKPDEDAEGLVYTFDRVRSVSGPVGCTPILALLRACVKSADDPPQEGLLLIAGGLLPESGWSLRVDVWPAPDATAAAALVKHLEGCVKYTGPMRDPAWTEAEALAFWKLWAPEATVKKYEKPVRTKHLIFLTDSTSPAIYVKLIEGRFAAICKALPADELEGRKLLPVLLFRSDDEFEAYYRRKHKMKATDPVDRSGKTEDHVYATSCDRGSEYGHSLDLAQLYLANRLRAWGGGHWFTAGLSEYVSSTPKDRLDGLRAVKKGKHTSIEKLLDDEAWGNERAKLERKGSSEEAGYWEQSGMWMEFLREGSWPKGSFERLVETVGRLPYGDSTGVQREVEAIYGMDLRSLEKKWVQYFSKR